MNARREAAWSVSGAARPMVAGMAWTQLRRSCSSRGGVGSGTKPVQPQDRGLSEVWRGAEHAVGEGLERRRGARVGRFVFGGLQRAPFQALNARGRARVAMRVARRGVGATRVSMRVHVHRRVSAWIGLYGLYSPRHHWRMLRVAALLAPLALVMALGAAASDTTAAKSVTIRVLIMPVTRTFTDVAPKTHATRGEYTKGDTLTGTSILRNAVRQFGKPKGARIGTSRFVETALSPQRIVFDGVSRVPGGTVHARGVMHEVAGKLTVAVVGGTGLYAAATGVIEGSHLPSGVTLDVARLQVP